jgi:hypothetical protein
MSLQRDPRRLVEYGARVDGVLRGALDAERASGVDAGRMSALEAKLSQRLAAPPAADAPAPAAPSALLGSKAAWMLAGAIVIAGATALLLGRGANSVRKTELPARADATVTSEQRAADLRSKAPASSDDTAPAEPAIATVSPADLPTAREPLPAASARTIDRVTSPERAEGEEIALLARAHEALSARPAESLALCREHQQRFASGHFVQEREAVAIEALVYLNRRAEAERRLGEFREHYPTSSHRGHLDSLFSATPASPR